MIKSINSIFISGECKRNVLSNTVFMLCDSVWVLTIQKWNIMMGQLLDLQLNLGLEIRVGTVNQPEQVNIRQQ